MADNGSGHTPRRPRKASGSGGSSGAAQEQQTPPQTPPQAERAKPRKGTMEAQLRDAFASLSLMVAMTGDQFSAEVISSRTDELAHAWAALAEKNESVKRVLKGILEGSAWGEVTIVSLSVLIPIAYRYNLVPSVVGEPFSMMSGVVPPSPEHEEHAQRQEEATAAEAEAQQQAAAAERREAQSEGERRVQQRQAAERRQQQQQQGSGDGDDDAAGSSS